MAAKNIIKWSPKATKVYHYHIHRYAEKAGLHISSNFVASIIKARDFIATNPYAGRMRGSNSKEREYILSKFPFLLTFDIIDEGNIEILNLFHTSRNPQRK